MIANRTRWIGPALAMAVSCIVATTIVAANPDGPIASYTGLATNLDPAVRLTQTPIDLIVDRWSSDADRDRLLVALMEKGQGKLLSTLHDLPKIGTIRTPTSLGLNVQYARQTPMPGGGTRVVLVTDRVVDFWESATSSRSLDYPFMVVELRLGPDGTGEGHLTAAAKIAFDAESKQIILENYGTQPVKLSNVRPLK